tara:strand:- start:350 stop:832 length:483 start_codon:yes stop_codon:yes gene_type:complete
MDYDKFKKDYEAFEAWNRVNDWEYLNNDWLENSKKWQESQLPKTPMYDQASLKDGKHWLRLVEKYTDPVPPVNNDGEILHPFGQKDMVNSPAHYTRGKQEAIEIIEEAIQDAPDVKAGMLQAQSLKYLLRLWLKGNSVQDAEKSRWYLNRLIEHLGETNE